MKTKLLCFFIYFTLCFQAIELTEHSWRIEMKSRMNDYGKLGLEIKISKPRIVSISPEGIDWSKGIYNDFGVWNFPNIWKEQDGRIFVTFNVHHDSALNYGLPGKMYFSTDNGKHWKPVIYDNTSQNIVALHAKPIDIPGGEQIAIVAKRPYKTKDIKLPENPLNKPGELHWPYNTSVFYRIGDFPRDMMAMKLLRRKQGQKKWIEEKSYIDWPEYTVWTDKRGILPIPFFIGGDITNAPDGSLLAMSENMRINKRNKALSKCCIVCLRSTDRGHTWKYWSMFSLPDLDSDKNTPIESELNSSLYEPRPLFIKTDNLICVTRSSSTRTLDHSMYIVYSKDMGKTWSQPKKITDYGVFPQLLKLKNGVIVLSYGRPGIYLRFSTDNGKTWGPPITLHGVKPEGLTLSKYRKIRYQDTCGYTGLLAIGSDKFLIVYSDTTYYDKKGNLRKRIIVREVDVKDLK